MNSERNPSDPFIMMVYERLDWVAIPISRGSSQPMDLTRTPAFFRQILYQLRHQGSPRILEWVTYPFSSGSF